MIAHCADCENTIIRYGTDEEMSRPCDNCGGVIFRILHLGFFGKPNHEFRMNIQTKELIDPDPCSELWEAK